MDRLAAGDAPVLATTTTTSTASTSASNSSSSRENKRLAELQRVASESETVFPASLITYLMETSGCEVADEAVKKLVANELQQDILEILADVKSRAEMQQAGGSKKQQQVAEGKDEENGPGLKLNSKDLEAVLKARDVQVSKAPYHPL